MKKFQFAAGLLAVGLMASCSSDAPEMPNNTPANGGETEETVATLAVRIAPSVTRADDTNEIAGESTINSVRIYVAKTDGTRIFTGYTETLDNNVAKIAITQDKYALLTKDTKYIVYVVCNDNKGEPDLKLGQEVKDITKVAMTDNFTMTNVSAAPVEVTKEETDGTKIVKIKDPIVVERVAVRYDYTKPEAMAITAKEGETTVNEDIKLEVAGAVLQNLNGGDYLFPHRGGDAFGTSGEWTTPIYGIQNVKTFNTYDYTGNINNTYGFALNNPDAGTETFNKFTYAAFKVKMDLSESKFKDMTGELYAYNHILLGNKEALVAGNFTTGDETTDKMLTDLIASACQAENFANAWKTMPGYHVYSSEEDGNYYTYYAANIKTGDKLEIVRNNVYNLNIKSFSRLGVPGEKTPEEQDENLTSLFFQFSVTVNPWGYNDQDWNF